MDSTLHCFDYSDLQEHQSRIANNEIHSYLDRDFVKLSYSTEISRRTVFANSKAGVITSYYGETIYLEVREFEKDANREIRKNTDALVQQVKAINEEICGHMSFLSNLKEAEQTPKEEAQPQTD